MPAETDHNFVKGTQVGDYLIGDLITRETNTLTYSATQVSVQREVVLCSLANDLKTDTEARREFISDVQIKASVDHPLISSVLEAVKNDTQCFFAMEKLHGSTLEAIHEKGSSIAPIDTARIIRNVASANQYLENRKLATLPLLAQHVVIDDKFHCRLGNRAVVGEPNPNTATRDKQLIGQLLHDLLEPGQPGSTRTGSLLDFMADPDRETPLSWTQIHDLADEVERQLAQERQLAKPRDCSPIQSPTMRMAPAVSSSAVSKVIAAIAVIAILTGMLYYFTSRKAIPREREIPDMVRVPAGDYPGPDGTPVHLREFWIDAHEVTIGEYAKFLQALNTLNEDQKTVYQHEDQPDSKTSHLPDDWEKLYDAAKNGILWNGLEVDLNFPVVGVDWWDAYAYAEWKGRRLPTREEWYAACSAGGDLSKLAGSGWAPVDQTEPTNHGIYGLAGNVSEWMRKRTLDPANPSMPARYIISGASYLRPKHGARAREWVETRNLRRADLGFRTTSTSPQED